jgi:phosphatidylglycerol lysyltransferase
MERTKALTSRGYIGKEGGYAQTFATLVAVIGALNLIAFAMPWMAGQIPVLEGVIPLAAWGLGPLAAALTGCVLLYLAYGMWHRRRMACLASLSLLLVSGVHALVIEQALVKAVLAGGLTLWLVIRLNDFDRPMRVSQPVLPAERDRARAILEAYGQSALAFLALLQDKYYYFSPEGSLVAYTVKGGVAVTLGDPIGPPENIASAISGFQSHCKQNGWRPAFCLTPPEHLEQYRRAGFKALCLGQEGVVDLHAFTLAGRASKSFRKRYKRFLSQGFRVVLFEPPIEERIMAELRAVSDEWLAMTKGNEKRFFLGWFYDDYIRNGPVFAVLSPSGRINAFANIGQEYTLNETTVDLTRRRPDVESGTMDFLFVSLFLWAREQGYDTFNLGLSALSGVGEKPGDPLHERVFHFIYENFNFYDFKGLRVFKDKFQPCWVPQYLVYPGLTSLPAVFMALVRANAGEGETLWDYFRPRHKEKPG